MYHTTYLPSPLKNVVPFLITARARFLRHLLFFFKSTFFFFLFMIFICFFDLFGLMLDCEFDWGAILQLNFPEAPTDCD